MNFIHEARIFKPADKMIRFAPILERRAFHILSEVWTYHITLCLYDKRLRDGFPVESCFPSSDIFIFRVGTDRTIQGVIPAVGVQWLSFNGFDFLCFFISTAINTLLLETFLRKIK